MKTKQVTLSVPILAIIVLAVLSLMSVRATELIVNGGFESGSSPWVFSGGVTASANGGFARTGTYFAWFGGAVNEVDAGYQTISIPANATDATLSFYLNINSLELNTVAYDTFSATIRNTSGTVLATVGNWSNINQDGGPGNPYYRQKTFNLLPYAGQTIRIYFSSVNDSSKVTNFRVDDASVSVTTRTVTVPTVTTLPATLITSTSARIWGRITSDGGASILERRLEWGVSGTWTDFTSSVTVSGNDFYYGLSGLSPNTAYQYRAWAKNSAGWGMSGAGYFTTTTVNYTITVNASPSAGGTVSGGGTFAGGSSRTVTATANSGYTFANWTEGGSVVSSSASYTFTLNGNRTLVANFIANPVNYTITVSASPSAGGTVSGGGTFAAGSSRTVTATANSGYTFANWTEGGSVVSSSASYSFTLNGNRNLVANFSNTSQRLIGVKIGVDPGHGGTDPGAVGPNFGLTEKSVNLATALALKNYLEAEGATVVMTRTTDTTVSLSSRSSLFVNNAVDLAISVHHNAGAASANSTMAFIYCDRSLATRGALASAVVQRLGTSTGVPISSTPASTSDTLCAGHADWQTGLAGVGQANLHMVREPEIQANILSILAEVSFISNPSEEAKLLDAAYLDANGWSIYAGIADYFGFIPIPRGGGVTIATVSAPPATLVTGNSARIWGRIVSDGGASIVERRLEWGVSGTWSDFTSSVTVSGNDFYYDLSGLSPNTAYQYRGWAKNSAGWAYSGAGYFTTANVNYTITVNASPSAGGTASGGGTFAAGSSRTITATANSGYTFANWTESGSIVSSSPSYNFTLNGNRTLVANFTANPVYYTIAGSASPSAGGTVSGGGTFAAGSSRTVTATANAGYTFANWTEGGSIVNSSASYNFTLNADRALIANFTHASSPMISNPKLTGTTFTLSVPTQIGFNYTLEYKNSVSDANWTAVQTIPGTGGTITLTDTGAAGASRIYRVRVQ